MKISDLLRPESISVPAAGTELASVLAGLLELLPPDAAPAPEARSGMARALAAGSSGEVVRFTAEAILAGQEVDGLVEPVLLLGVTPEPIPVSGDDREAAEATRIVFLLLAPRKLSLLRARVAPVLRALVSGGDAVERLLAAGTVAEVQAVRELFGAEIPANLLVHAALEPVTYRVYPETPIREVLDLMSRRRVHAVPVVGERYEVLGIISSGDALRYLVPRARTGTLEEAAAEGVARDIMSRSVLCVSEDQSLRDVAAQLVSRDVEQMPVVREGELVGFVTRDTVLRTLFGPDPTE